jgi:ATP-binding cassette, subfamily F, member 3
VLVSHDRALLRTVCDDFMLVCDGEAVPFDGTVEDYISWLATRRANRAAAGSAAPAQDRAARREARETAAAERQQKLAARRPLLKEAERLEKQLAQWQQEKQGIDARLADPAFYASPDPAQLRELTTRQAELAQAVDDAESRWLAVHDELEALGEP